MAQNTRPARTATTRSTRWCFVQEGDRVIVDGQEATVTAAVYAAPWRDITLSDGRQLSAKGSWRVDVIKCTARGIK